VFFVLTVPFQLLRENPAASGMHKRFHYGMAENLVQIMPVRPVLLIHVSLGRASVCNEPYSTFS
jgi:hypothetical protein